MNKMNFDITFSELREQCEQGDFDTEYAEYIMENGDGSVRTICNGNTLTIAMEDGYLFDEFVDHLWFTMFQPVAV